VATKKRNLAVLVGNGLSIAFNPKLGLGNITKQLVKRIAAESDSPDEITVAMRRIADRYSDVGKADYDDFENLVGAFGGESRTLEDLTELAKLVEPSDTKLQKAIQTAARFAQQVRDTGISHVLEIIFEEARAYGNSNDALCSLVQEIIDKFDGRVTFGNLNYDTLLLSALLSTCQSDLTDLGDFRKDTVTTNKGKTNHTFPRLRTELNFPAGRRVRLLHLHGSLTYWKKSTGSIVKLNTDFLDSHSPWQSVRTDSTTLRPVVVLANQRDKSGIVAEYPFSLAYSGFAASLSDSDHWLIVGYSFRDECVNEMLRAEFEQRDTKPTVLVVSKGPDLTRDHIVRAFGWDVLQGDSKQWLSITRHGASKMALTVRWKHFSKRDLRPLRRRLATAGR
jgi:hypothetical protein